MSADCPVLRHLTRGAAGLRRAARRDRRAARRLAAGPLADARARLAAMQAEVDELVAQVARLDADGAGRETAAQLVMRQLAPRVDTLLAGRIDPDAAPDPGALAADPFVGLAPGDLVPEAVLGDLPAAPDDPLVTMPDRREAVPIPPPTEPGPRHAAAEPSHTLTGPLRAVGRAITSLVTGGHPTVQDGPEALAALTALSTPETGDTHG